MSDAKTLLDQVRDGNPDALRSLLEQFGQQVWDVINRDIGAPWRSSIDADDVMQVTYMEAFLQSSRIRATDEKSFTAWLQEIAKNNLRDAIKQLQCVKRPNPAMRVHAGGGHDDSCVALVELIGATSTTPSRMFAKNEVASAVENTLARMPPDYSTVIRMYDLEGRGAESVASSLGRSTGAVYMLRARAHEMLRTLIEGSDFFTGTS